MLPSFEFIMGKGLDSRPRFSLSCLDGCNVCVVRQTCRRCGGCAASECRCFLDRLAGGVAGVLDPNAAAMLMKDKLQQAEADLGEATKLDTFNCDLNLIIDESGCVYALYPVN